ncbi:MAG: glycosyltransferase [Candidatus Hermodarchaeota archaeon]
MKTNKKPVIGVITPVYNGEKFIEKSIQSVLSQSFAHWKYIIMDGKSTDRTVDIVKKYSETDVRITLISEPDEGMYDALIKALDHINTPICCWINADDKLMPWTFELVVDFMKKTDAKWVTGIPSGIDEKDLLFTVFTHSNLWYPQRLIRAGLFHGRALGWLQQEGTFFRNKLYKKIDREKLDFIKKQRLAGDFFLWTELAKFSRLNVLPTVLAAFRFHRNNASLERTDYYNEIKNAGFWIPPKSLSRIIKLFLFPFMFIKSYSIAYKWKREYIKNIARVIR